MPGRCSSIAAAAWRACVLPTAASGTGKAPRFAGQQRRRRTAGTGRPLENDLEVEPSRPNRVGGCRSTFAASMDSAFVSPPPPGVSTSSMRRTFVPGGIDSRLLLFGFGCGGSIITRAGVRCRLIVVVPRQNLALYALPRVSRASIWLRWRWTNQAASKGRYSNCHSADSRKKSPATSPVQRFAPQ